MRLKKGAKAGVLSVLILFAIVSSLLIVPVFGDEEGGRDIGILSHTSSASIFPVWSRAGIEESYTVTICNVADGNDSIDEVRIYESTGYTITKADNKEGWYKSPEIHPVKRYYQYTSLDESNHIEAGECTDFTFKAITPLATTPTCDLQWKFETRDISNEWKTLYAYTSVDEFAPETTKTYGEGFYSNGISDWINLLTPITLTADDGSCSAGVDKTWYITLSVPDYYCEAEQNCVELCDNPFTCTADSVCHNTEISLNWCQNDCLDNVWNNQAYNLFEECVEACGHYCCDGGAHYSEGICSPIIAYCSLECDNNNYDDLWQLYSEPFNINEESCHLIQFFSVDNLGNYEEMNHQCVYVDDTPPEIEKEVGDENIPCSELQDETCNYWITQSTPITLKCQDVGSHPSNNVVIHYRWNLDGGGYNEGSYNGEEYILYLNDSDSVHELEFWCKDAVGLESEHDIEIFRVDSTPPIINKTMIGDSHVGDCPPTNGGDVCYVLGDGNNGVAISVADPDPTEKGCNIDDVFCTYELWWNDNVIDSDEFSDYAEVIFKEDSEHILKIHCQDALGNSVDDEEVFFVDNEAPVTTKTYEGPYYYGSGPEEYIDTSTLVNLTAEDEKVGVKETYYKIIEGINDDYCWKACDGWQPSSHDSGDWNVYTGPFNDMDESCHVIEFFSVDLLDNKENVQYQCVFVDKTAPEPQLSFREPHYAGEVSEWINSQSQGMILTADIGPHPSGVAKVEYRTTLLDGNEACEDYSICQESEGIGNWNVYENKLFTIPEDSCHLIEIKATDNVGKFTKKKKCIFVDNKAPEISKEIIGPKYIEGEKTYIDGVTEIEVTAMDPEPHPVGGVTCEWSYILDDGSIYGWYDSFPIKFLEETKHDLQIRCVDALGNGENDAYWDYETFYVDKTPPVTSHKIIGPWFEKEGVEWIDGITTIELIVEDAGTHKTRIKETKYRVSLVEEVNCLEECSAEGTGEWKTYNEPFGEIEESCHLIEYFSIDNVNKTENANKYCVFVDKTAPKPVKEIGEPKVKCQGAECEEWEWKITKETPITLSCEDIGPHPSGGAEICWRGWWDKTQEWTEWKCQPEGTEIFLEESCLHELEFYCRDNVEKESEHDKEWIKVEGRPFKIEINKKWNLISVPVVLLNNDPKIVFEGYGECIESIWTYDGTNDEWYVYTLDDINNDNLNSIVPGWGYWIKAKDECTLVIGGDLLAPKRVPPSRKLAPGWNLIGYYGREETEIYDGPDGEGKIAYCALNSLTSSLLGLPKWSSLYGYWESEFEGYSSINNLDPGAGYWISMKDDQGTYIYSPSTECNVGILIS